MLKSDWLRAFLEIAWEPDFSYICKFRKMLVDYKYFHLHHFQTKLMNISGPILESKGMCAIFQKKGRKNVKKDKKGQNIWKFGQKCTKFENIFKKGRWLCVIIALDKLLEKALYILLKSPKILLWGHFWLFLVIFAMRFFPKYWALSRTSLYGFLTWYKVSEKSDEQIPRKLQERRRDIRKDRP